MLQALASKKDSGACLPLRLYHIVVCHTHPCLCIKAAPQGEAAPAPASAGEQMDVSRIFCVRVMLQALASKKDSGACLPLCLYHIVVSHTPLLMHKH